MPTIHYQFAHVTMRNIVLGDAAAFFDAVKDIERGRSVLVDLWVRTEASLRSKASATGLDLKPVDAGRVMGFQAVLIAMPPPANPPEAFGALATWMPGLPESARYFTLELGPPSAKGESTQSFGEWRIPAMHIGAGPAPSTDLEQLVNVALEEIRASPISSLRSP